MGGDLRNLTKNLQGGHSSSSSGRQKVAIGFKNLALKGGGSRKGREKCGEGTCVRSKLLFSREGEGKAGKQERKSILERRGVASPFEETSAKERTKSAEKWEYSRTG